MPEYQVDKKQQKISIKIVLDDEDQYRTPSFLNCEM
jgi:hypothetical protein